MTQKTKLEIIGPYTPEHEGPFCTRDGKPVRLLTKTEGVSDFPIVGFIKNAKHPAIWDIDGNIYYNRTPDFEHPNNLMNAREVPVAREFWVNEYVFGELSVYASEGDAKAQECAKSYVRTIHVREVMPGEE